MTTQRAFRLIAITTGLALAVGILLSFTSCTHYSEYDGQTGHKIISYTSTANIGTTTDQLSESDSSGGISAFGFDNERTTAAMENQQALASVQVGQMTITGTVDHSTWVEAVGNWTWRIGRTIATGKVAGEIVDWFRADDLAGHATDQAAITAATETNATNQAAKIASDQIGADAATDAARIAAP